MPFDGLIIHKFVPSHNRKWHSWSFLRMRTSFLGRMRVRPVLRMQGGVFAPVLDIQKPRLKGATEGSGCPVGTCAKRKATRSRGVKRAAGTAVPAATIERPGGALPFPTPLAIGPVLAGGTPALPPASGRAADRPPAALRAPFGGCWVRDEWYVLVWVGERRAAVQTLKQPSGDCHQARQHICCIKPRPHLPATRPGGSTNTKAAKLQLPPTKAAHLPHQTQPFPPNDAPGRQPKHQNTQAAPRTCDGSGRRQIPVLFFGAGKRACVAAANKQRNSQDTVVLRGSCPPPRKMANKWDLTKGSVSRFLPTLF